MHDETHPYQPENLPIEVPDKTAAGWRGKLVAAANGLVDVNASVAAMTRDECHVAAQHFEGLVRWHFKTKPGRTRSHGLLTASRFLVLLYHNLNPQPPKP